MLCRTGSVPERQGVSPQYNKSFDAKSTDKYLMTDAKPIRLNIPLIPCKAEWCLGYLNYKKIKVSVGGQTKYLNVHNFDWADGFDFYAPTRIY